MAKAARKNQEEQLPDSETLGRLKSELTSFVEAPRFEGVVRALHRLLAYPPQTLLLEGGTARDRLQAAMFWALLLNCPERDNGLSDTSALPCLNCPVCLKFLARMHRDFFFFDGTSGQIKIDDIREMRAVLGEPPREARCRVAIFYEAQALGEPSANSLLKSLEEPRPGTHFVLTAPQRERLLPTLVSRSWVLTLPWPVSVKETLSEAGSGEVDGNLQEWVQAMEFFFCSGQGWMDRTARRGAVDPALSMQLVLVCQKALLGAMSGSVAEDFGVSNGLTRLFARLSLPSLRVLGEVLYECQDSLNYMVNPTLVLDWMVTRVYFLFVRDGVR